MTILHIPVYLVSIEFDGPELMNNVACKDGNEGKTQQQE